MKYNNVCNVKYQMYAVKLELVLLFTMSLGNTSKRITTVNRNLILF